MKRIIAPSILSANFAKLAEAAQLVEGVEDNMVADGRDLLDLLGSVSRRKHMVLACHLLMAELCLIEPAGRRAI